MRKTIVYRNKNIFLLLTAQIVSVFGDKLSQMAFISLISIIVPDSTKVVGILLAFALMPVLFVSPLSGVFVDHMNYKRTLITCDILRGIIIFFTPFAAVLFIKYNGPVLPFLYGVAFITAAISRFFIPARLAFIPKIVQKSELQETNSFLTSAIMLSSLLGLAAGDIILTYVGWKISFIADSGTFFISAVLISFIFIKLNHSALPSQSAGDHISQVWREFLEGILLIWKDRRVRYAVGSLCVLMGGAGSVFSIIVVVMKSTFSEIAGSLGIMLATLGLGGLLGAFILQKIKNKITRRHTLQACFILAGLFCSVFGLMFYFEEKWYLSFLYIAVCSLGVLSGICLSPIMILCDTLLHEILPQDTMGRVFGAKETLLAVSFIISNLAVSFTAEYIPDRRVLLLILGIVLAIVGYIWATKGILSDKRALELHLDE
jgi:MFS family permease